MFPESYAEYYFPGRYEIAFGAFVYSVLIGVVALAATAVVTSWAGGDRSEWDDVPL